MQLTDRDLQQAIDSLGLEGTPAQFRRVYFEYVLNFSETIAAAGSATATQQINKGGSFIVQAIKGGVFIPAAATAAAYTPLYHRPSENTLADLTWESLWATRLDIRTVDMNWFSAPIRGALIMGDALDPFYLPTTRPIAANDEVTATLYNDSTLSVRGQVTLCGHKLIRIG